MFVRAWVVWLIDLATHKCQVASSVKRDKLLSRVPEVGQGLQQKWKL